MITQEPAEASIILRSPRIQRKLRTRPRSGRNVEKGSRASPHDLPATEERKTHAPDGKRPQPGVRAERCSVEGGDPAFRTGNIDFCGVRKTVNLAFTPEVEPGDFVLVHVGFAISRVDQEEAARTYGYLKQIGALEDEGLAPKDGQGDTP